MGVNLVAANSEYLDRSLATFNDAQGTVVIRFKTSSATLQTFFSSNDTATTNFYFRLAIENDGDMRLQQFDNDGTADQLSTSGTDYADGLWHTVCFKSSGTAYKINVDGVDKSLTIVTGANNGDWFADTSNRDNIVIGAWKRTSALQFFDGDIAYVKVYDRELSDAECAAMHFGEGLDQIVGGRIAEWRFDEATTGGPIATAIDISGSGFDLTGQNTPTYIAAPIRVITSFNVSPGPPTPTTIYLSKTGSNTSPYDTPAKGSNTLQTLLNFIKSDATEATTVKWVDSGVYSETPVVTGITQNITLEPTVSEKPSIGAGAGEIDITCTGAIDISFRSLQGDGLVITTTGDVTIEGMDAALDVDGNYFGNINVINANDVQIFNCTNHSGINTLVNVSGGLVKLCTCRFIGGFTEGWSCSSSTTVTIDSCIFFGANQTDDFGIFSSGSSVVTSRNNTFFQVDKYLTASGGTIIDKTGDDAVDPAFITNPTGLTQGDVHVKFGSPTIDKGNVSFAFNLEPTPDGGIVNRGRYGNTSEAQITLNELFVSKAGKNTSPYDTVETAANLPQTAINFWRDNAVGTITISLDPRDDFSSAPLYDGVPMAGDLTLKPLFVGQRVKVGKFKTSGGSLKALKLTLRQLEINEDSAEFIDLTNQSDELTIDDVILKSATNVGTAILLPATAQKLTVNNLQINMQLGAKGISIGSTLTTSLVSLSTMVLNATSTAIENTGTGKVVANSNILEVQTGLNNTSSGEIGSRYNQFINVTTKYGSGTITDKTQDKDEPNAFFVDKANGNFELTLATPLRGRADPVLSNGNGTGGR